MIRPIEINETVLANTIKHCRERKIILPTFAQQKNPETIASEIKGQLRDIGLWDVNPLNLFRITWKNEPVSTGGLFNDGNLVKFPKALTGCDVNIVGIVGKYFPTGAHKVGAGYGCLVPQLVTGNFDPSRQKAVWPSTGNYCRGGAFDCALLGCAAIAILPEEMSQERFEWLRQIGTDEIIATPGCESNVKEIYDKCWELRAERGDDIVVFNQFEEFGNAIWHYHMTGSIIEKAWSALAAPGDRLSGYVTATGSAGTIAAGDYLKTLFPQMVTIATEALQCPTLLQCGFGGHRIEGIGDKHVPWIHNVRQTDMVAAVDDEQCMSLLRLFNEPEGAAFLQAEGVEQSLIEDLPLLGISSICNLVAAIKTAKYYEMNDRDWIFLPLTDSAEMYQSRINELRTEQGAYTPMSACRHFERYLSGISVDYLRELNFKDRQMLHNFKYFTWVEQQGRDVDELRRLWDPDFWVEMFSQIDQWDRLIVEFNQRVGNQL